MTCRINIKLPMLPARTVNNSISRGGLTGGGALGKCQEPRTSLIRGGGGGGGVGGGGGKGE